MIAMASLGTLLNSIQGWLFPMLEDELGELDEQHRELVALWEICHPQSHMDAYRWLGDGCPPNSRLAMIQARYGDKIAGHISRDGTAIHGRQRAAKKTPMPTAEEAVPNASIHTCTTTTADATSGSAAASR